MRWFILHSFCLTLSFQTNYAHQNRCWISPSKVKRILLIEMCLTPPQFPGHIWTHSYACLYNQEIPNALVCHAPPIFIMLCMCLFLWVHMHFSKGVNEENTTPLKPLFSSVWANYHMLFESAYLPPPASIILMEPGQQQQQRQKKRNFCLLAYRWKYSRASKIH